MRDSSLGSQPPFWALNSLFCSPQSSLCEHCQSYISLCLSSKPCHAFCHTQDRVGLLSIPERTLAPPGPQVLPASSWLTVSQLHRLRVCSPSISYLSLGPSCPLPLGASSFKYEPSPFLHFIQFLPPEITSSVTIYPLMLLYFPS